jgi:PAS domain S-box-containing protein
MTENALKQSEFRYRHIVETAQEGIWQINENNSTTFVNRKMCEILEYPENEILGKDIFCFMDDSSKQGVSESLALQKEGLVENIKVRYITKTGKHIWVNMSGNPVYDEQDHYKGALAMVSDITEKKNLEDMLDKVNNLARIGNWSVDLQKNTVNWSGLTRQIHEVAIDYQPEFQPAINFYKEGFSRDSITMVLKEAIEKGVPWDIELQLVTAKTNEKWVRVTGEAEFINDNCVKLYGSFQDIDVRKRAEVEVLKAYEEKNTILESIGDAFFAVDNNWVITYWNKEAEKLVGRSKTEIIGHHFWEIFFSGVDSPSFRKYHEAKETDQIIHFEDYYEPLNKWYEISAYPSASGLSVYFREITERKLTWIRLNELNESLQKNAKELAVSNAELEQFAYVASHDLQEPLRMITSFLNLVVKMYGELLDEKGKQYIHFAVDGAKRMRQIILDLLEFSRVGRKENSKEKVVVNDLIKEIILLYHKQIEETGAVIQYTNLPSPDSYKAPLRQVFQNLIGNAIKYCHAEITPVIDISCTETEDYWQFAVKDNGIGIEAEFTEKIFIIFQRLHNQDEYSGTGMGLAICKKIIENLEGKIWVVSEEGKGSTFFFTIKKIS